MNTQPQSSREFIHPVGLHFGVPHDYAKYCLGKIVAVDDNLDAITGLRIAWDSQWVTFQCGRTAVQYAADRLVRLLVNYSESVSFHRLSTLRALFRSQRGSLPSLPIFTCGTELSESMKLLVAELNSSDLPFVVQEVDDATVIH